VLRLCVKDWVAARWLWLVFALVFCLYVVQPGLLGLLFPLLGAGLVFGSLAVSFALDERCRAETLYASLPLTRARVVRARYLLAGLLAVASGALIFGSLPLLASLARTRGETWSSSYLLSVEGGAGFLLLLTPAILLFLPLAFHYGFGRGILRFGAIIGAVALGAGALVGPTMARTGTGNPLAGAVRTLGLIRSSMGTPLFVGALLAAMTALTYASLALSIKAYDRREL
jgi:hypothetical protein